MVALLSEVRQEGSSVFSLFSVIKLNMASHPLASSYSGMTVSSVFCAQNIFFRPKCVGQFFLLVQQTGTIIADDMYVCIELLYTATTYL